MGYHGGMKRITVLLLAAPVLFATGCSGGGGSDTNAGSAPTTAPVTSSPTAAPSSEPTAPDSGGGKPVSRCHTSDLALKPGEGGGAAGTAYQALVFTNTSSRTCTLYGYPGVSWVAGSQGAQVGDPFQRGGTHKKVTVTLTPGRAAHTNLQMPNAGNYDDAKCKPVSVRGLRVYPPDETAAVFVTLPSKQCSAKGVNIDTVWAISAGTDLDPQ
jgi:Protein of unknown function (DUF4232)